MNISDEDLMAYADGELQDPARSAVDSAMREDSQVQERVAAHRRLRAQLQAAYSAELAEAIPSRLLSAVEVLPAAHSGIADLQAERQARTRQSESARALRVRWRPLASMAASIIVGLGVGYLMWGQRAPPLVRTAGGELLARGRLAAALDHQLAADQPVGSPIKIGISFLAKSGEYCRTFAVAAPVVSSGLACRDNRNWQIAALLESSASNGVGSEYQPASSGLSAEILSAVQARIAGEPLNQDEEARASQRHWNAQSQ